MQTPEGLTSRPLVHGDARAVFEVIAAQELEDIGMIEIEAADIVGDWAVPASTSRPRRSASSTRTRWWPTAR
jgi:hypothetical protein